jgi:hypothetical protein
VADSTAMASLTVLLSGMMLARREKVKAGGDIFSGVWRSADWGLDEAVFSDLEELTFHFVNHKTTSYFVEDGEDLPLDMLE